MFEFKAKDARYLAEIYDPKLVWKASSFAIRDTGNKLRTQLSKSVREQYRINASVVKSKSKVWLQPPHRTTAEIYYTDNRPHLGRFATSNQNKPVVKIRKKNRAKPVSNAFYIKNRPDFKGLIWKKLTEQEANSARYANRKVKIKVLRTIAVPEMVRNTSNLPSLQNMIETTHDSRFSYHFQRLLFGKSGFRVR